MILKQKIKGFFDTKNSNVETKSDKVSIWLNLNKSKYQHLFSFARKYIAALLHILKDYFLKLGVCMTKKVIDFFRKTL